MSETIKHIKYGTVNLGCCENLYYTTYHQLTKEIHFAISKGEIYDPKNYLAPKYPFYYRFPVRVMKIQRYLFKTYGT